MKTANGLPSGVRIEASGDKLTIELAADAQHVFVLRSPVRELQIRLGPRARLQITDVRGPVKGARESADSRAVLEAESRLEFVGVAFGEGFLEHRFEVDLKGKESSVSLKGLSVLSGDGEVRNATIVHHAGTATVSRQLFKDILSDRSKSAYTGLVHVHRGADKADSNQLNRNLLLSDDAAALSEPQLKIDADDVKCTHGSSTGQLPEEEIFYLRSRGLNVKSARSLLINGFAEEILQSIPAGDVRRDLEARVLAELAGAPA